MGFQLSFGKNKGVILIWPPVQLCNSDFSVRGIERLMSFRVKWIYDSNCEVQALASVKNIFIVKVVLYNRLDYVYTLFPLQYADFVSRISYQDYQCGDAAQCAHDRGKCISSLINAQIERFAKLVEA